jgi:Nucleotide-diphospho-sugar transferase
VMLLQPNRPDHCLAIVGQWESNHMHNFRRIPKSKPRAKNQDMTPDKSHPLRYVNRGVVEDGKEAQGMGMPTKYATKDYWPELVDYLNKQEATLQRLQPIVREAAGTGRAVVVMLVNFGQVSLFVNFVCAARARGLDLSNIVMFATDPPAVDIARTLGVRVFDVQDAFGYLPQGAARVYGDMAFKRMMLAKVYCVHLVVLLGYDVLFQDVDMTWYRNPIEYFNSPKMREFDLVFQDDGARSTRYAPWSPNTGLYFVRNSPRTVFFFNMFCRMGDVILKYRSHQGAMTALISEHSNWKGLRVKVIEKDSDDGMLFPGGYHFHRRRDFMRQMMKGEVSPYLFHMSWTENKDHKIYFMQQLAEWFVHQACENKTLGELDVDTSAEPPDITSSCCSAEPLVECHYRDKPSKIPCRRSPPIDKGKRSFW